MKKIRLLYFLSSFIFIACNNNNQHTENITNDSSFEKGSYGYDAAFIKKHANAIELQNGDAKVLLSADYQGRVFTSTATGDSGLSFGWINYKLFDSAKKK